MASEEYVRSFWWFVVVVPLGGLVALITARGPLQVFGMLAVLWPFSIPARAVLFTTKASRLFTGGCHVEAGTGGITFIGEYNKAQKRLRFHIAGDDIKSVVRRRELLLVRTYRPGIAPIKVDAFQSDADLQAFLSLADRPTPSPGN